jgi:hypothetical protein
MIVSAIAMPSYAQGPQGRDFGFGIVLGEPLGGTVKLWTAHDQAFVGTIGASYFGSPRIGADYLWHFEAFHSNVVKMYAGPGLALGVGSGSYYWYYGRHGRYGEVFYYREPGSTGIAMRVVLGLNIIPRRTPMEIFLEAGPLIGIAPAFGAAFDLAAGIRFYP